MEVYKCLGVYMESYKQTLTRYIRNLLGKEYKLPYKGTGYISAYQRVSLSYQFHVLITLRIQRYAKSLHYQMQSRLLRSRLLTHLWI